MKIGIQRGRKSLILELRIACNHIFFRFPCNHLRKEGMAVGMVETVEKSKESCSKMEMRCKGSSKEKNMGESMGFVRKNSLDAKTRICPFYKDKFS